MTLYCLANSLLVCRPQKLRNAEGNCEGRSIVSGMEFEENGTHFTRKADDTEITKPQPGFRTKSEEPATRLASGEGTGFAGRSTANSPVSATSGGWSYAAIARSLFMKIFSYCLFHDRFTESFEIPRAQNDSIHWGAHVTSGSRF